MKTAFIAIALALCASAASAAAVEGDQTTSTANFTVIGSAPKLCSISAPVLVSAGLINFTTLAGSALPITQLTDRVTLSTKAASAKVDFDAVCNFAHVVKIESQNNGLWRDGSFAPPGGGLANAVPWSGRLMWGPVNQNFQFNAQNRQIEDVRVPVGQPTAGLLELDIAILAGQTNNLTNAPLQSGTYSDTIYVTLEPQ